MLSADRIKKIFHVVLAIILLLVGVLGLILPVLNGIIPIVIGLILLSFENKYVEKKLEEFAKKDHRVEHWYKLLVTSVKKFFKKT
jgi:uncharacterized membrane protein HdeD (DUF308 family)